MADKRPRAQSPYAVEAARLLGAQIRHARRERRWSQDELAARAGVSTRTLSKVEHGDMSVGLGVAFEAAALVGVPLFHADRSRLSADVELTEARSALLRRPSRTSADDEVNDDF